MTLKSSFVTNVTHFTLGVKNSQQLMAVWIASTKNTALKKKSKKTNTEIPVEHHALQVFLFEG